MNSMNIRTLSGAEARSLVDPFYEKHGGRTRADDSDVFFVAETVASAGEAARVVGTLRFCHEESVAMLRGMLVDNTCRHQGIGLSLLESFDRFLIARKIDDVYCLPFSDLEHFYQRIGFRRAEKSEIPDFLSLRLKGYLAAGNECICMRRITKS